MQWWSSDLLHGAQPGLILALPLGNRIHIQFSETKTFPNENSVRKSGLLFCEHHSIIKYPVQYSQSLQLNLRSEWVAALGFAANGTFRD